MARSRAPEGTQGPKRGPPREAPGPSGRYYRDAPLPRMGARPRPRPGRLSDPPGGGSRGRCAALEPEPGEESRAGRAGAGRPGFRKRRAVLEVSGAWALGARDPGRACSAEVLSLPWGLLQGSKVWAQGSGARRGVPPAAATPPGALGPANPPPYSGL